MNHGNDDDDDSRASHSVNPTRHLGSGDSAQFSAEHSQAAALVEQAIDGDPFSMEPEANNDPSPRAEQPSTQNDADTVAVAGGQGQGEDDTVRISYLSS